jgi:hypothetical protein
VSASAAYANQTPCAISKRNGGKMIEFIKEWSDKTIGCFSKWVLWKFGLVDLIWFYGRARIVKTDPETGARFIRGFGDYYKMINVDEFLDHSTDYENKKTYTEKNRYENGTFAMGWFTGFWSRPKVRGLIFKTKKTRMLHLTASWDRENENKDKVEEVGNAVATANHTHQYIPSPPITVLSGITFDEVSEVDQEATIKALDAMKAVRDKKEDEWNF